MLKKISYFFVSLILLYSCNKVTEPSVQNKPIIKIGVLLPETGTASSNGESSKAALNYLMDNKALLSQITGNSSEYDIELEYYNTQTSPELALKGLQELYEKGIHSFIGPFTSAELAAVMDYAESNKLVLISPSSVTTSLSYPKKNVFRFITDDSSQAKAVAKYMQAKNINYLSGLNRNDVWGADLINMIVKNFLNGSEAENIFSYNTDLSDLTAKTNLFAEKMFIMNKEHNDYAGYIAAFSEGTQILETLSQNENLHSISYIKLIGSSGFANNASVLNNSAACDFAIMNQFVCPNFGLDIDSEFLWGPIYSFLKNKLNRRPEIFSLIACDALQILVRANLTARKDDNEDLKRKIKEYSNVRGITGDLSLNQNNDRKFGNYNFWALQKNNNAYSWEVLYTYNTETDEFN